MKENTYPWELLNSTVLMLPEEVLCYHVYKYEYFINTNCNKEALKELEILKSYISKKKCESEGKGCSMQ